MHQIKIFHIFVPNLGEIYRFGRKIAFSVKLRPFKAMADKKLILGLKRAFIRCIFSIQRIKPRHKFVYKREDRGIREISLASLLTNSHTGLIPQ